MSKRSLQAFLDESLSDFFKNREEFEKTEKFRSTVHYFSYTKSSLEEALGIKLTPHLYNKIKSTILLNASIYPNSAQPTDGVVPKGLVARTTLEFVNFDSARYFISKLKRDLQSQLDNSSATGTSELVESLNTAHTGHVIGVATVRTRNTLDTLKSSSSIRNTKLGSQTIKTVTAAYNALVEIDMRAKYSRRVSSKGTLSGNAFIVLLESGKGNSAAGSSASTHINAARTAVEKYIRVSGNKLIDVEGSPSLYQLIKGAVIGTLTTGKVADTKLHATNTTKKTKITSKRTSKVIKPTIRLRSRQGKFTNVLSIKNLINTKLHDQLRSNMGSPALNYQSGRFAKSAEVTHVQQTRTGMVSIFYTYMKNPYQTFEPGYRQGSVRRDPNRLISKSIREIATGLVSAKLRIQGTNQ